MHKTLRLAALTALLASCAQQTLTQPGADTTPLSSNPVVQSGNVHYIQHEVIVGYDSEEALKAALRTTNGKVIATIPEIKVALLHVNGDALKTSSAVAALDGVRYATANYATVKKPEPIQPSTTNLDSLSFGADQKLDGPTSLPQYALDPRHLNAQAAWNAGLTGKGVTVAVVDDPADITHPDLAPNWGGKAYDPVTGKTYTNAADWKAFAGKPNNSHGTFVASSIVSAKNGSGIVGLAHESKVLPVAIFNPGYVGEFAVARGIIWSVNNGARVINNSWGGGLSFGIIKASFDYAMSHNVVIVASMGNSFKDEAQYPAALPGVMASGAADASRRKVTFSTSGRHISSSAPGQDTLLASPTWLDPKGIGNHALISGTSFSSPYTAAVAALAIGQCPAATPYQIRKVLEETADGSVGPNVNGFDRETGYGHLNAGAVATRLTSCANLPAKGANVKVQMEYYGGTSGNKPGILANVILRGKGLRAGAMDDPTPLYQAPTDEYGNTVFAEIAPGEYDIYVAGPDLSTTGGLPEDRGSFVGTLTATSGSTQDKPDFKRVVLLGLAPDLNPVDPYEPNDDAASAKTVTYGSTSQLAYIHGKPRDMDWFAFSGTTGDQIKVSVLASAQLGGQLDSYVTLYGADGTTVLAKNDDRGTPRIDSDSELTFTLTATGTHYLMVTSCKITPGCTVAAGQDDNSPFNKYRLKLEKTN